MVRLYNPGDTLVSVAQVTAGSDGSYTATLTRFPSAATASFPFGTYTLSVFSAGDEVEVTVEFTEEAVAPPVTPTPNVTAAVPTLSVQVAAGGLHLPGEPTTIYALVTTEGEMTDPDGRSFTVWRIARPDGTADDLMPERIYKGLYSADYTPTLTGVHAVHVGAKLGNLTGHGIDTFTVTESLATAASIRGVSSSLATVNSKLDSLSSAVDATAMAVSALKTGQGDIESAITSAQGTILAAVNTIPTDISSSRESVIAAVNSAKSDLNSAVSSAKSDLDSAITAAQTSIQGAVSSAVSSAQTTITGKIDPLADRVDQVSTDMAAVSAAVGQSSTFILVVAAIAAITLVLELVILVRKLS